MSRQIYRLLFSVDRSLESYYNDRCPVDNVDDLLNNVLAGFDHPAEVMQIFKFATWSARFIVLDPVFRLQLAMETIGMQLTPTFQSGRNYARLSVAMVETALFVAHSTFLTALLNCGVCDIPRGILPTEFWAAATILRSFRVFVLQLRDISDRDRYTCRMGLKQLLGEDDYISESNRRGARRMICTIKALKVLEVKRFGEALKLQEHVHCFRLYFRAIPEPFISRKDVEVFLRFYFRSGISEDMVERLGEDYESLFGPESSAAYAPRSLKHLSRLSVRKSLQWKATALPTALKALPIPASIIGYLKCNT